MQPAAPCRGYGVVNCPATAPSGEPLLVRFDPGEIDRSFRAVGIRGILSSTHAKCVVARPWVVGSDDVVGDSKDIEAGAPVEIDELV